VHEAYETRMLDRNRLELVADVNASLANWKAKPTIRGGANAAVEIVEVMRHTVKTLPPSEVIAAFNDTAHDTKKMWQRLRAKTVKCITKGCQTLAELWESAWKEGSGKDVPGAKLKKIPPATLQALYNDRAFVESMWLDEMVAAGIGVRRAGQGTTRGGTRTRRSPRRRRPARGSGPAPR
jgi:hypothetical protein